MVDVAGLSDGARATVACGAPGACCIADAGATMGQDPNPAAWDDATCGFQFALCLLEDPLGYVECARMNAEHCDLLTSLGPPEPADGGQPQPSAACLLQLADCIMGDPMLTPECFAMLDICML